MTTAENLPAWQHRLTEGARAAGEARRSETNAQDSEPHKLVIFGTGRDVWGRCSAGSCYFVWLGTYAPERGRRARLA